MADATLTARSFLTALVAEGVHHFVLCPGSRSAPLAYALSALEDAGVIDLVVETDERVAAFVALGYGKVGEIAAVVTTSGSAVANLHPAVEEACHSGTGMLVVTADRPHELRHVRASQTTNHLAVLGGSVAQTFDIPTEYGTPTALRGIVRRAVRIARGIGIAGAGGPAPVHINIAFREPLFHADPWDVSRGVVTCAQAQAQELRPVSPSSDSLRTVVIAGSGDRIPALRQTADAVWKTYTHVAEVSQYAEALASICEGVPVLAEPATILRSLPTFIPFHPILLGSDSLRSQIEQAIVIGHPTLTREVSALLADQDVRVIVVDESPTYTDVSGNAAEVISYSEISSYLHSDPQWLAQWREAAWKAEECARTYDAAPGELDFARVARVVDADAARIPTLLAASSIIREVNLYASNGGRFYAANRGLAGIDGTISTASGMSRALRRPVRVVLGDLAFIHDVGGLFATAMQARPDVQVVLIDDGGGSLFATLEYGEGPEHAYERAFQTKKVFVAERIAQALGRKVRFVDVSDDAYALRAAFDGFNGGFEIVYVRLGVQSQDAQRSERSRLRANIAQALSVDSNE